MKKVLSFLFIVTAFILCGCKNNSYARLLKEEKRQIRDYIKREGLLTTNTFPEETEWDEKVYYAVPGYDYMYFHLDYRGDSVRYESSLENGIEVIDTIILDPVRLLETVVIRYKKFTLSYPSDTLNYWTTLDGTTPLNIQYGSSTGNCEAWQIAIGLMRYSNSQCTLICPSKQGFVEDQNTVTAYGYILNMKIKR